ncbi:MAG: ParB/RepB/Spo0J family partition protein [Clostridiaceae bacterium]
MEKSIKYISTDLISSNVYQPRKNFNEDSIEELAESIKTYGIIQPVSVRKLGNRYELVAGERRLRAAKSAGIKEIPAIIIDITDKDSAAMALLENIQREDLNFLEEAEAYQNLIAEHGYTQEELSKIIGKKQSTIANKIRILKLDEGIRKSLIDNQLTERHGRALLKLPSEVSQKKILNIIIKSGYNVARSEELVEKELLKYEQKGNKKEKKIKSKISPRIYINTIKQVFDKFGVDAKYKSKEMDDCIQVTILIPKE